ncbi:MAG: hypothetical protein IPL83_02335 [Bdellovibrionales bacterium]|nr:hypothetical protein [Bdellovibrionales bacterium]
MKSETSRIGHDICLEISLADENALIIWNSWIECRNLALFKFFDRLKKMRAEVKIMGEKFWIVIFFVLVSHLVFVGELAICGEIDHERENLLLKEREFQVDGANLKVDVFFLSPAWRIKRQGKEKRLIGMSEQVVRSLHDLDPALEYRCIAEATYRPKGIVIDFLEKCSSIWRNN